MTARSCISLPVFSILGQETVQIATSGQNTMSATIEGSITAPAKMGQLPPPRNSHRMLLARNRVATPARRLAAAPARPLEKSYLLRAPTMWTVHQPARHLATLSASALANRGSTALSIYLNFSASLTENLNPSGNLYRRAHSPTVRLLRLPTGSLILCMSDVAPARFLHVTVLAGLSRCRSLGVTSWLFLS